MKNPFLKLFLGVSLVVFTIISACAQVKKARSISNKNLEILTSVDDSLATFGKTMLADSNSDHRFMACHAIMPMLKRALTVENSFKYKFDRTKSLSIQYPADSSFRIFSWQLFVDDSTYRYFGAIQLNDKSLKFFPLNDYSDALQNECYEALSPEKWYGALYYRISELDSREGKKYLLYGFDAFSFFEKRKVLDVLTFQEGKPVFGAPVFNRSIASARGVPEMRLILTYSAETNVSLNFSDEYGMILFDHLISAQNPYQNAITRVPDGSYEGFKIKNGRLEYISKVFNDSQETAPRPVPVLDNRKGKSIFGN
jgi:hypothetical protein